ncbi:hypothetical protein APHAL10511_005520 [Amanita phalloides]|nr:hypothetical protein APHAL10511_005520 [Amanita phalloides]
MRNGRTSASSVKKKRGGSSANHNDNVGVSVQISSSVKRAVHQDGSHCSDDANSARAWKKRLLAISYGGEMVYPTPPNTYHQPVILKKIVITEANRIAKHKELTIIEHVGQLADWGIAKDKEQEIWLVVQKSLGVPEDRVMRLGKPANPANLVGTIEHTEGQPIKGPADQRRKDLLDQQRKDLADQRRKDLEKELEEIRRETERSYQTHYQVQLPKTSNEVRYRFQEDKEKHRWRGVIVGFEGAEFIPLVLETKPAPIPSESLNSKLAEAWRRKIRERISYGGEKVYRTTNSVYRMHVVIKSRIIREDADASAMGELVEILRRANQLKDSGILEMPDGQMKWLVVQKFLGSYGTDSLLGGVSWPLLRQQARDTYALDGLTLPENDKDNVQRYRYMLKDGKWTAIIVGWKGAKFVPPIKKKPKKLCMHSVDT